MDAIRRTSKLRRVATTASLAALLIPVATADAKAKNAKKADKPPVITNVSPMEATVGEKLTIKGKNFRKGKGRNAIGFKRDGAPVVFLRSSLSTEKTMIVPLTDKLEKVLYGGTPARFGLRVLTTRFGKSYTANKLSPTIAPRPDNGGGEGPTGPTGPDGPGTDPTPNTPAFNPAGPEGDCDGDTVLNKNESGDIDNDLLSDKLENDELGTDPCKDDSDGDKVLDGYEYKAAIDLNDDEYQNPNVSLPYPGERPYPNPMNADAATDYDGDSLTLLEEHNLWVRLGGRAADETFTTFANKRLSYSDGLQHSVYERCPVANHPGCVSGNANRRVPTLRADGYAKQADFLTWANANGYGTVALQDLFQPWWVHVEREAVDIRDVNRDGQITPGCGGQIQEALYYDYDCDGYLSDDERDEDADGLTNYDEAHGRSQPGYWLSCYTQEAAFPVAYAGTELTDADSDNDGVRDGADDQDHDDLPNMMELSRMAASVDFAADPPRPFGHNDTDGVECVVREGLEPETPNHPDDYGKVNPFDACDPYTRSRTCTRHPAFGAAPDPNWWSLQ